MSHPQWKPEIVEEPDPTPESSALAVSGLMLALKALSQRAVVALEACFALFCFVGVWTLWYVTPNPSVTQIWSLSIFALFALVAVALVLFRRRR